VPGQGKARQGKAIDNDALYVGIDIHQYVKPQRLSSCVIWANYSAIGQGGGVTPSAPPCASRSPTLTLQPGRTCISLAERLLATPFGDMQLLAQEINGGNCLNDFAMDIHHTLARPPRRGNTCRLGFQLQQWVEQPTG
jgi:hypothetical protein